MQKGDGWWLVPPKCTLTVQQPNAWKVVVSEWPTYAGSTMTRAWKTTEVGDEATEVQDQKEKLYIVLNFAWDKWVELHPTQVTLPNLYELTMDIQEKAKEYAIANTGPPDYPMNWELDEQLAQLEGGGGASS